MTPDMFRKLQIKFGAAVAALKKAHDPLAEARARVEKRMAKLARRR